MLATEFQYPLGQVTGNVGIQWNSNIPWGLGQATGDIGIQ